MPKRVNRRVLEAQSDRIEAVLAHHKVPAKVTGGVVAPAWIRFQILPQLGAKISKIKGLAEEFALALNTDTCRVSRNGGNVVVEIPREDARPIRLLPLLRAYLKQGGLPFGTALLGFAEDGVPLMVRLPSPQVAHLLVAGTTGSGKSALSRTIITSLALTHRPSQLGFVLIDPKGRGFGPFAGLPHLLRPILTDPQATQEVLQRLVQLMLQRDRDGRAPATDGKAGDPRVVVVIDELADLLMMTDSGTRDALTRLSQRGREAGIHVIACTQKPASSVVGGLAKANFPVRLVGRVTSPEEAKVATGYAGTGAERLRGPGDFIVVAGGQVTRFQAAWVSPAEITALVAHMRGPAGRPVTTATPAVVGQRERPALVRRTDWRSAVG